MDFGMPTLIETSSIEDCAALCRRLGLRFVELNMNLPQYDAMLSEPAALADVTESYGIYFTIHLDENLNISDFNSRVAAAYLETVLHAVRAAKALGAPVLNMHLSRGVYFTLPDRRAYLFDEYRERYLDAQKAFRDAATAAIGNSGVRLCVENSDGYTGFQLEALDILLESPAFALTFDIGHNLTCGGADESHIMHRADRLCHMHLHDTVGKSCHLPLGEGALDLSKYLKIAKENGCRVVLETKTINGLARSVEWLRSRESELFG